LLDGLPPGRSVATRRLGDTVAWARAQLGDDDLAYLAELPAAARFSVGCLELLCFHGSPRSDLEPLLATTRDDALDAVFAGARAHLLAAGHTHLQLLREYHDSVLINPGSVGLPLAAMTGSPPLPALAEYAVVTVNGSDVEISFRRLPIDVDALRAASALMPHPNWASDLEQRVGRWNAQAR
jgi:predicted phosphodiesterase